MKTSERKKDEKIKKGFKLSVGSEIYDWTVAGRFLQLKNEIEKPFLFLCVGEYCKKHRLTAPIIINGIYLCVAEQDEFSTPAQPLLKTAKAMTNLIYGG